MNDWDEFGKDILTVIWCIYATVMFFITMFNVTEWVEVYMSFFVWAICLALPMILRGK